MSGLMPALNLLGIHEKIDRDICFEPWRLYEPISFKIL